ncbi:MAG: T9SS type A sorting domain-containing protein [Bacteroidales bacterium]
MKKITFFLMIVCCCYLQPSFAQFEIVSSDEYGRIFNMIYDDDVENRVYALTMTNHILQSDDNGETWHILYSHPGSITGLKLMPENNALTFWSTRSIWANYGVFILDLESLAITKEYYLPGQNADNEWISSYCIWEQDTDVALVLQEYKIGLASFSKVQYTTNGGADWTEVYYSEDNYTVTPNQVAIHPNDSQTLYITLGHGKGEIDGGLFYSIDGGQTWKVKLEGIILDPIAFNPENPDEIYVGTGIRFELHPQNLYRSTNAGDSWDIVPISWTNYTLDNITHIAFNPVNSSNIIILEENEVVISEDHGETWTNYVYENAADSIYNYYYGSKVSFNPFNENEVFVSCPYYPLFSADKGVSFNRIRTPYTSATGQVEIFENDEEKHLFYGIYNGYIHKNMITGEENAHGFVPLNISVTINADPVFQIDKNIPGRIFTFEASFMDYALYVSDDFGENKHQLVSFFSTTFNCLATTPSIANTVWLSVTNTSGDLELHKINFNDLNNVISAPLNVPGGERMIEICIDPENPEHIVTASETGVYYTTDGAENWKVTTQGLTGVGQVFGLTQNPLNTQQYTIATDAGIFTSTDGGFTWSILTDSFAHYVQHSNEVDGHILAAVYPCQESKYMLHYSSDGGNSWKTINNDELKGVIAYTTFTDFRQESADIYINSVDLGLIRYTIEFAGAEPWSYNVTDQSHTIDITDSVDPSIFGDQLEEGDWVGVFYTDANGIEQCGGAAEINANGAAVVMSYGDDPDTPAVKEGFATGEEFIWRMYDASEDKEYDAEATYDMLMPNLGNFANGGFSRLSTLEATATGIEPRYSETAVDICPNPAHDIVKIHSSETIRHIIVLNQAGQTMMKTEANSTHVQLNISNLPDGIFFVRILTNRGVSQQKLVIK